MTTQTTTLPTHEQIHEAIAEAMQMVNSLPFHKEWTINDYPIGGSSRGKCRLATERTKRGYRTVRTTTNKRDQWCKPKKSIYEQTPIGVVTGPLCEKEAAWIRCSIRGDEAVYLQMANGDLDRVILKKPKGLPWCKPRREDRHYRMVINGVPGPDQVDAADPPELCDAWDVWEPGMLDVIRKVRAKVEECGDA